MERKYELKGLPRHQKYRARARFVRPLTWAAFQLRERCKVRVTRWIAYEILVKCKVQIGLPTFTINAGDFVLLPKRCPKTWPMIFHREEALGLFDFYEEKEKENGTETKR